MHLVREIVVGADFSSDSRRAVAYAGELAKALDARLTVTHIQRLVLACILVVAFEVVAHARCGDRPGDDAGVAAAVDVATAACPCDNGVRSERCLRGGTAGSSAIRFPSWNTRERRADEHLVGLRR